MSAAYTKPIREVSIRTRKVKELLKEFPPLNGPELESDSLLSEASFSYLAAMLDSKQYLEFVRLRLAAKKQ